MSNFSTSPVGIYNTCDEGRGKCCALCQYVSTKEGKWGACSDSCMEHIMIKDTSCLECKHRQPWMK